jgi:CubicO group peptidase (beta-lactamase class C family)
LREWYYRKEAMAAIARGPKRETMLGRKARPVLLALMFCLLATGVFAQKKKDDPPKPAQSIAQLRQQLEKILQDTHTPGLSVAIVHRDGPEWVAVLGKSNVATNQAATDDTLFPIASIGKGFVSLSILKLANEGKLSLNDPVHTLVPEVWFENRWEATDPVRVVDLLEDTTGWDDWHWREYAKDGTGLTRFEGLDYDHHSRTSRWRPGTRMAYCNSGSAVATYIVEKLTGQRFDDYFTQNFSLPIGMKTATYLEPASPQLTTTYGADGKTPIPHKNILEFGAIKGYSAKDMAAYVQFYLNRGAVAGTHVMPTAFIDRMETPTRTWEAQKGLKAGYGLSNFTSIHDGFVYHGHDGGGIGVRTDMAYMPEYDVGYFYGINAQNEEAFQKIGNAIRAYITRGLTRPSVSAAAQLPANAQQYAGWYEPAAPRSDFTRFFERFRLQRVHFERGNLVLSNMFGRSGETFVHVGGEQFRYLPRQGPAPPIATAALLAPDAEGRFFFVLRQGEWKRVPTWFVIVEAVLVIWFLLAFISILLYAPFWVFGGLIEKRRRPAERAMRLWPLIAALSLLAAYGLYTRAANAPSLGNLTIWSFGIFLTTSIFGVASIASVLVLWLARKHEIRSGVRWFSIAVTSALLIATAYLAYWGVIGIRTWA